MTKDKLTWADTDADRHYQEIIKDMPEAGAKTYLETESFCIFRRVLRKLKNIWHCNEG